MLPNKPIDVGMAAIGAAYMLLPDHFATKEATVMLLAIGLQESKFEHRWQIFDVFNKNRMGVARGWWQFEAGGGVAGVLRHRSSAFQAAQLCRLFDVKPVTSDVYQVLHRADMDALAAGFARLLLWTDPKPLPRLGDAEAAWALYQRVWRPGRPHPATWAAHYQEALDYVHA